MFSFQVLNVTASLLLRTYLDMEISIRPDVFIKIHSNTLYVVKPINLPKQQIIEKALSFVKNIYVTAWR